MQVGKRLLRKLGTQRGKERDRETETEEGDEEAPIGEIIRREETRRMTERRRITKRVEFTSQSRSSSFFTFSGLSWSIFMGLGVRFFYLFEPISK